MSIYVYGNPIPAKELAEGAGINPSTLDSRLRRLRWPLQEALTRPVRPYRQPKPPKPEKPKTLAEECRERGISEETVKARMRDGWSRERALSVPVNRRIGTPKRKLAPHIRNGNGQRKGAAT